MICHESAKLAPETLGFVELNFEADAPMSCAQTPTTQTKPTIRALRLLSNNERAEHANQARQAWLDLVSSGDYQQAYEDYNKDLAKSELAKVDSEHLLALIEYFLTRQSYLDTHSLIVAAKAHPGISNDPDLSSRLSLLSFICNSLTDSASTIGTSTSLSPLWTTSQRRSRRIRSLLRDIFVMQALRDMAVGRRKTAAGILDALAAKEQHQDPVHDSFIDVLRQACEYGTLRSVQSRLATRTRRNANVIYKKKFACAIDSVAVYGNGKIIVVQGWHVNDPATVFTISLVHNRCLFTAEPTLTHRYERADLAPIARQYGIDERAAHGFSCTFILGGSNHLTENRDDCEWNDVILSTETGSVALTAKSVHKELTLADMRHIINLLIGDDMNLRSYTYAKQIKDVWSHHIEARSHEDFEHYFFCGRSKRPDVSILIPLYGRIDFMEFQLHWFFHHAKGVDGSRYTYQIIYCLDDPANRDNLLRMANKCAMLYGIPFEIIINAANLGYAASNNVAAKYAQSDTLLLLNSDVIPRDHNSIDSLISTYQLLPANKGALGAKLLYPSNDIQHVGMTFYKDGNLPGILSHCWLNEHPHKHIKHTSNPALQEGVIETEAATAACLLIRKDIFEELGGFRLDYIAGDFEDSDLCLRLRQLGRSVLVCLDAVFFHLERQSMVLQAGHGQQALKLVAFNAYTHHERHSDTIEEMKSRINPISQ